MYAKQIEINSCKHIK